ncbi:unannotated protein [freshwater metagenome]|uniref:Unannotated protein n=1 Tax=freshwater metagenome TaxID=449393 RepID=A0A6J7BWB6_9ZZZZ
MQQGRAHVQVVRVATVVGFAVGVVRLAATQRGRRAEVRRRSNERNDHHQATLHWVRVEEAADGLEADQHAHDQDAGGVGLRRQDRAAVIAERARCVCRSPGEAHCDQRHHDRGHIGEVVRRIRQQSQRRGDQPDHHLHHHDHHVQTEGNGKPALFHPGDLGRHGHTLPRRMRRDNYASGWPLGWLSGWNASDTEFMQNRLPVGVP